MRSLSSSRLNSLVGAWILVLLILCSLFQARGTVESVLQALLEPHRQQKEAMDEVEKVSSENVKYRTIPPVEEGKLEEISGVDSFEISGVDSFEESRTIFKEDLSVLWKTVVEARSDSWKPTKRDTEEQLFYHKWQQNEYLSNSYSLFAIRRELAAKAAKDPCMRLLEEVQSEGVTLERQWYQHHVLQARPKKFKGCTLGYATDVEDASLDQWSANPHWVQTYISPDIRTTFQLGDANQVLLPKEVVMFTLLEGQVNVEVVTEKNGVQHQSMDPLQVDLQNVFEPHQTAFNTALNTALEERLTKMDGHDELFFLDWSKYGIHNSYSLIAISTTTFPPWVEEDKRQTSSCTTDMLLNMLSKKLPFKDLWFKTHMLRATQSKCTFSHVIVFAKEKAGNPKWVTEHHLAKNTFPKSSLYNNMYPNFLLRHAQELKLPNVKA